MGSGARACRAHCCRYGLRLCCPRRTCKPRPASRCRSASLRSARPSVTRSRPGTSSSAQESSSRWRSVRAKPRSLAWATPPVMHALLTPTMMMTTPPAESSLPADLLCLWCLGLSCCVPRVLHPPGRGRVGGLPPAVDRAVVELAQEHRPAGGPHGQGAPHRRHQQPAWLRLTPLPPPPCDGLVLQDVHDKADLAHYARACTDIVFRFPFGLVELQVRPAPPPGVHTLCCGR